MRLYRWLAAALIACIWLAVPQDGYAAADNSLGMALMSAAVTYQGQLVRGSGATAVSIISLGRYLVSFDRDVADCTWVVNAGTEGSFVHGVFGPDYNSSYAANQLVVVLEEITGATSNTTSYNGVYDDFNVIVFCAR
jgi:hypothetical protein